MNTRQFGPSLKKSNMTSDSYKEAVLRAKEHILAGDIFQIVLSQRFEYRTFANPFEIYRALRIVNPSPYMAYLQVMFSLSLQIFNSNMFLPSYFFSSCCSCYTFLSRLEVAHWLVLVLKFLLV